MAITMLQKKRVHSVKTLRSQTSMETPLGSLTSCVPSSLLPLVMQWAGWETPWQNDGKAQFSKKHWSQTLLEIHTLSRARAPYLMLQSCSRKSGVGNNTFCNSGDLGGRWLKSFRFVGYSWGEMRWPFLFCSTVSPCLLFEAISVDVNQMFLLASRRNSILATCGGSQLFSRKFL